MPKPARKFFRITVASVCAFLLGMVLETLLTRSSASPETDHPHPMLSHEHLAVLSHFPPSSNFWPRH